MLRELIVRHVKPVLPPGLYQGLRRLDPTAGERDAAREARQAAAAARSARKPRRTAVPMAERDLTWLAKHFGTDKWGPHRYPPHYERHLVHLKNEAFTLLELGIGGYKKEGTGGASLRMWREFFPRAQILGLDIVDKSFVNADRIRAYHGSQTDAELLRRIVADADNLQVVIDDGSHRSDHIIETFGVLFPLLPIGGIYAIEDTQTSYWEGYGGSHDLTASHTSMAFVKTLLDDLNYEEFTKAGYQPTYTQRYVVAVHAYHNLVVIEKGDNNEKRHGPDVAAP
ncbi:MAG: hypothetical protein JWP61_805 [Friedmanniella sp.]|nr:hypothetical protein [Friedmanniella sp.]